MSGQFQLPACICGSRLYSSTLTGTYDRLLLQDYSFEIVCCEGCRLARTLPVPDQRQYDAGYALTTDDGRFIGAHDDDWSERTVQYVRRRAGGSRLIDVGCSVGNLVASATAHGYEAVGIDPDAVATADDVRGFFAGLERVLEPGGYALILVPYYRGLMPRLMRDHWIGWFPSQHVWHFTPKTLRSVAEGSSGLRLVEYTTKGVIEPSSAGPKGRAKAVVAACSRAAGWGDEIEALFRKGPHDGNGH